MFIFGIVTASIISFVLGMSFRTKAIRLSDELLDRKRKALDELSEAVESRRASLDQQQTEQTKSHVELMKAYAAFAERREKLEAGEHTLNVKSEELLAAIAQHNETVAKFKESRLRMFSRTPKTYIQ